MSLFAFNWGAQRAAVFSSRQIVGVTCALLLFQVLSCVVLLAILPWLIHTFYGAILNWQSRSVNGCCRSPLSAASYKSSTLTLKVAVSSVGTIGARIASLVVALLVVGLTYSHWQLFSIPLGMAAGQLLSLLVIGWGCWRENTGTFKSNRSTEGRTMSTSVSPFKLSEQTWSRWNPWASSGVGFGDLVGRNVGFNWRLAFKHRQLAFGRCHRKGGARRQVLLKLAMVGVCGLYGAIQVFRDRRLYHVLTTWPNILLALLSGLFLLTSLTALEPYMRWCQRDHHFGDVGNNRHQPANRPDRRLAIGLDRVSHDVAICWLCSCLSHPLVYSKNPLSWRVFCPHGRFIAPQTPWDNTAVFWS